MQKIKHKLIAIILALTTVVGVLSSCSASMSELIDKTDQWADDTPDSMWGDGSDDVWDNTTDIEYYVNSVLLFEPWVTDEFSEIEVLKLEYDNDAEYYYKQAMDAEPAIPDAFFNAGFFYLKQKNFTDL